MPTVAADADTMVKNLSDELSRLQPPTPTRRSSLTANVWEGQQTCLFIVVCGESVECNEG